MGLVARIATESDAGTPALAAARLVAPTMDGVRCERGLAGRGYLIPWSRWRAGDLTVRTEVCEVRRPSPGGAVFVVGADGALEMRVVQVGLRDYVNAEVLSGLERGEVVSTGERTTDTSSQTTGSTSTPRRPWRRRP